MSLALEVRHLDGGVHVTFVGVLDEAAVPELQQELRPLLARYDADQLEFEWSGLARLDPAGLDGLLHTLRNRDAGERPTIRGASPAARSVLETSGAIGMFVLDDAAAR